MGLHPKKIINEVTINIDKKYFFIILSSQEKSQNLYYSEISFFSTSLFKMISTISSGVFVFTSIIKSANE